MIFAIRVASLNAAPRVGEGLETAQEAVDRVVAVGGVSVPETNFIHRAKELKGQSNSNIPARAAILCLHSIR